MLDTLSMLDIYLTSEAFVYAYGRHTRGAFSIPPQIYALQASIGRAVVNIWRRFQNTDIRLPHTNSVKLDSLLQA